MKKILVLLLAAMLLVSCTAKETAKNDSSAVEESKEAASTEVSISEESESSSVGAVPDEELEAKYDYVLGMKSFIPTKGALSLEALSIQGADGKLLAKLNALFEASTDSLDSTAVKIVLDESFAPKAVPAHLLSQAYQIEVGNGITVTAASEQGLYYGVQAVAQYRKVQGCMAAGTYLDWPDVASRTLHLDIARKYLPKDWIIETIKSAARYKLNEVELHFSENEGFRIECETDPAIMSDEYLTKDEIREIIAAAKEVYVEIIPSFDSPGHLLQVLKAHPEYQLVDVDGYRSKKTLDITNPEAVAYIKSLLDEYAELFSDCKYFNIGGDESFGWSDINRMKFSAWKILENHAKATYGENANAHDSFVAYLNGLAAHMEAKGFTVRAWNDGLIRTRGQATVNKVSENIGICYWSNSSSLDAARVEAFVKNGNTLYNVNEEYMYYVLKEDFEQPDARLIFDEWTAGVFNGSTLDINAFGEQIRGAYYCIWCDRPDVQTPEEITQGTYMSLRSMATKAWNGKPEISFGEFTKQVGKIQ